MHDVIAIDNIVGTALFDGLKEERKECEEKLESLSGNCVSVETKL